MTKATMWVLAAAVSLGAGACRGDHRVGVRASAPDVPVLPEDLVDRVQPPVPLTSTTTTAVTLSLPATTTTSAPAAWRRGDRNAVLSESFDSGAGGRAAAWRLSPTTWEVTVEVWDAPPTDNRYGVIVSRPDDYGPTICFIKPDAAGSGRCTGRMEVHEGGTPQALGVLDGRSIVNGSFV
jgi:hypothetical protein